QKDCASRKLPEKASVATNNEGEEGRSKTTAEASGIAMKGQPTE
ncbi:MAG: methionine synthase, partial [Veillonella nakazawae]